jgi:hypothetical protein
MSEAAIRPTKADVQPAWAHFLRARIGPQRISAAGIVTLLNVL